MGVRWPQGYAGKLPEECHLIFHQGRIAGRITSISHRSTLGYALGMAFVEPALAEPGTNLTIRLTDGSVCLAQTAKLPFYDPANQRQGK